MQQVESLHLDGHDVMLFHDLINQVFVAVVKVRINAALCKKRAERSVSQVSIHAAYPVKNGVLVSYNSYHTQL